MLDPVAYAGCVSKCQYARGDHVYYWVVLSDWKLEPILVIIVLPRDNTRKLEPVLVIILVLLLLFFRLRPLGGVLHRMQLVQLMAEFLEGIVYLLVLAVRMEGFRHVVEEF